MGVRDCMSSQKLSLAHNQQLAIESLKSKLKEEKYPIEEYIVFGSVARGAATDGSDLDLLALTSQPISHRLKHSIYGIVTEMNLKALRYLVWVTQMVYVYITGNEKCTYYYFSAFSPLSFWDFKLFIKFLSRLKCTVYRPTLTKI